MNYICDKYDGDKYNTLLHYIVLNLGLGYVYRQTFIFLLQYYIFLQFGIYILISLKTRIDEIENCRFKYSCMIHLGTALSVKL